MAARAKEAFSLSPMTAASTTDKQPCRLGPGLFGSRARGDARADSDFDLLINDAASAAHWA